MRHWRLYVWVLLWLIPLPYMPDVLVLYWPCMLILTAWVIRVDLVLEPKWSIDLELAEIQSWT